MTAPYEVFLADTQDARDTHYRLRYQVYCLENAWEDPARFPDDRERDEFDEGSVPFLVRRTSTGAWVGTLRLVPGTLGELPALRHAEVAPEVVARPDAPLAEVSRLCVVSQHRAARDGDALAPCRPTLFAALLDAAVSFSRVEGIGSLLFLVADALARLLRRLRVPIRPAGPPIERRGTRRPYLFDVTGDAHRTGYAPPRARLRRFSELAPEEAGVRRFPRARAGVLREASRPS